MDTTSGEGDDTIIAGNSGGRCLARVIDIVDGPGGTIVEKHRAG